MPKLFDRVKVNIATTGTGTVTFGSASTAAFLTPTEAGCVDGDTVRYCIVDGTDYEIGIGTIASNVATMARTTVTESKISGTAGTTKLDLSGTAVLALVASAADIVNKADVTTVGNALLTATDAAAAQTAAGGTTVGKALFTATDAAAARSALELETLRQNVLLDRIYQAKSYGLSRRVINAFADGYKASDGIAAGSSSGYTLYTAGGYVYPATVLTQINAPSSTAAAQGYTFVDRTTAVTNGSTIVSIGFYSTVVRTIKIKIVLRNSANNYTVVVDQSYSHGGTGWEDVTLSSPYTVPGSGTYYLAGYMAAGGSNPNVTANGVSRAYILADLTGTGTTTTEDSTSSVFPLRYGTTANMTLVTTAQPADSSVSNGRVLIESPNLQSLVGGTDYTIEVSCDGGSHWTAAGFYNGVTANSQGGRTVVETNDIACTAGTSFQARIKTLTNKSLALYGTALTVH